MTMFSCTMSLRSVSSFRRLVFPSVSRVSLCTSVSAWNFPWKSTWYLTCESALWIFHRASCKVHTNGKLIHVFHTDSRWTAIYWAHGNPCLGLSHFTLEKRSKHGVQRLGYEQCLRSLLALYNWQRSPLRYCSIFMGVECICESPSCSIMPGLSGLWGWESSTYTVLWLFPSCPCWSWAGDGSPFYDVTVSLTTSESLEGKNTVDQTPTGSRKS